MAVLLQWLSDEMLRGCLGVEALDLMLLSEDECV